MFSLRSPLETSAHENQYLAVHLRPPPAHSPTRSPAPSNVSDSDSDDEHSSPTPSHLPDHDNATAFDTNHAAASHRNMSRSSPCILSSVRGPSRHGDGTTSFSPAPFLISSKSSSPSLRPSVLFVLVFHALQPPEPRQPLLPSQPGAQPKPRPSRLIQTPSHGTCARGRGRRRVRGDQVTPAPLSPDLPRPGPALAGLDVELKSSSDSQPRRTPVAPNALPFRPRSSTGPSITILLTAAFQTATSCIMSTAIDHLPSHQGVWPWGKLRNSPQASSAKVSHRDV